MNLKLITAILMTMATVAWLASALLVRGSEGSLTRWGVVAIFGILAVFYWRSYFRSKNSSTGTE